MGITKCITVQFTVRSHSPIQITVRERFASRPRRKASFRVFLVGSARCSQAKPSRKKWRLRVPPSAAKPVFLWRLHALLSGSGAPNCPQYVNIMSTLKRLLAGARASGESVVQMPPTTAYTVCSVFSRKFTSPILNHYAQYVAPMYHQY